jgi:hypothetical protein
MQCPFLTELAVRESHIAEYWHGRSNPIGIVARRHYPTGDIIDTARGVVR